MKWTDHKKLPVDFFEGIEAECFEVDGQIRAVEFTREDGRKLRIERGASYGENLRLLTPKEPPVEERYLLAGTYRGLGVSEYFEDRTDANSRHRELENDPGLTVSKVQVPVDDEGKVLPGCQPKHEEIPF